MARSDFKFSYRKRVRYAEIDAQAVVFNSRYLEYVDIGVVEYWRAVGMPVGVVEGAPEFQVAKAIVNYKKPIRLDEEIDICVRTARLGRSSMATVYELHGAGTNDLRAEGEVVQVHVDLGIGRSARLPEWVVDLFEQYEQRPLRELILSAQQEVL